MKLIMACDCGATGSRAGLYNETGELLSECEGGPANAIEHGPQHCATLLAGLARTLLKSVGAERLDQVAAGVAGAARLHLRQQIADGVREILAVQRVRITDDLHPILIANSRGLSALVATAGTGSSVLARSDDGKELIVGGHGRIFGDEGSAYSIAVSALRAAANSYDGAGPETDLVDMLPQAAGLEKFVHVAEWANNASKGEIAGMAKAVFAAAANGDKVAFDTIRKEAHLLASQVLAAARRLGLPAQTPVFMNGSVFSHSQFYVNAFKSALEGNTPVLTPRFPEKLRHQAVMDIIEWPFQAWMSEADHNSAGPVLPSTERRLEDGKFLDQMQPLEIVQHMAAEDAALPRKILAEAQNIADTIDWVADAIRTGGRLIYIGAGTSGRLGVLDASECPPTFGVSRDRVIGIIAGGEKALRESIELAEDDVEGGVRDLDELSPPVGHGDVVIGIAASGRTPYVLGALREAGNRGAKTVLFCCNPAPEGYAQKVIAVETGPEVVAGSTRLKAGTATKMVLNMITTGAMALAGYVHEGYMIGVQPVNAKLVRRAARITAALTGLPEKDAMQLLHDAGNSIAVAVLMAKKSLKPQQAEQVLKDAGNSLRRALEE